MTDRNILLKIRYDGAGYSGWQRQPEEKGKSVQHVLERALANVLSEPVSLNGAGRTDSGVHALAQYANFHTERPVPCDKLVFALNNILPQDVSIAEAQEVDSFFHARFSPHVKTYRYTVALEETSVFCRRYVWEYKKPLDIERMRAAAAYILGEHDFGNFSVNGSPVNHTVRNISAINIFETEQGRGTFPWLDMPRTLSIEVSSNSFLYKMVRIIAARLVDCGSGECEPAYMRELLSAVNPKPIPPAPAQGLMLMDISYKDLDNSK